MSHRSSSIWPVVHRYRGVLRAFSTHSRGADTHASTGRRKIKSIKKYLKYTVVRYRNNKRPFHRVPTNKSIGIGLRARCARSGAAVFPERLVSVEVFCPGWARRRHAYDRRGPINTYALKYCFAHNNDLCVDLVCRAPRAYYTRTHLSTWRIHVSIRSRRILSRPEYLNIYHYCCCCCYVTRKTIGLPNV